MDGKLRPAAQGCASGRPVGNFMLLGHPKGELVGAHFLGHVFWANKKGDSLQQGAKGLLNNTQCSNQE